MSSITGNKLKISIFGQSHSASIGIVIDGFPSGFEPDFEGLNRFMKRRSPSKSVFSTERCESDEVEILSGFVGNVTCGAPICAVIKNCNAQSNDYNDMKNIIRPSHADYSAHVKYDGFNDKLGGGHLSGRLTAPMCFAGALCMQYLQKHTDINISAHIYSIKDVYDTPFDMCSIEDRNISSKAFPVTDDAKGEEMLELINKYRKSGDSLGGIIECAVSNIKAGVGDPIFDSLEGVLAKNLFAIPAVKAVEFGSGFKGTLLSGSENNDAFALRNNEVVTLTNNAGGINGGISNGMPIVFRVGIKPTPSIYVRQKSVELASMQETEFTTSSRHDACIVPRVVPVVEAISALTVLDLLLSDGSL